MSAALKIVLLNCCCLALLVNRIENGKVNISLTNILEIAKALNIPAKELLDF